MISQFLSKVFIIFILSSIFICSDRSVKSSYPEFDASFNSIKKSKGLLVPKASKVKEIELTGGYSRLETDSLSFGFYLQNLPLNTHDNNIYSFDGKVLSTGGYHYAIIDIDIGNKDLQQCADAVMRLRAEYLYQQKRYNEIHFNFLSDGKPRYYNVYANGDRSYKKFRKYLDYIFSFANSGSLRDELLLIDDINKIKIGDVFVQKGNPIGHAVIIVDMAVNNKNGKKVILIAQSYMPAQSIHILLNPNDKKLSPWYDIEFKDPLTLPAWTFNKKDLRRFK